MGRESYQTSLVWGLRVPYNLWPFRRQWGASLLVCHCEKKTMQVDREQRTLVSNRSLETLSRDFTSFTSSGAVLHNAKHHNNVIRHCILPIASEQVCIPVLHLDLGIFPYLYDAFCTELHAVDLDLVKCPGLEMTERD